MKTIKIAATIIIAILVMGCSKDKTYTTDLEKAYLSYEQNGAALLWDWNTWFSDTEWSSAKEQFYPFSEYFYIDYYAYSQDWAGEGAQDMLLSGYELRVFNQETEDEILQDGRTTVWCQRSALNGYMVNVYGGERFVSKGDADSDPYLLGSIGIPGQPYRKVTRLYLRMYSYEPTEVTVTVHWIKK